MKDNKDGQADWPGLIKKTYDLPRNRIAIYLYIIIATILLAFLCYARGIAGFSPDSWSYFELSKTIFGNDFYRFNTFRSYYSDTYSTSFPLGYPILLALVHLVTGLRPLAASYINVIIALATVYLIFRICRKLAIPICLAFATASALLLYPFYFDEVLAGRSIPLALLFFVSAAYLRFEEYDFIAGLLLGAAALVRFDFLPIGIVFIFCSMLVSSHGCKKLIAGFLLGILPWVIYSVVHFGTLWASDNSWVIFSATPAFVLDYPAAPDINVIEAPLLWAKKIGRHCLQLARVLIISVLAFPAVLCFFAVLAFTRSRTHKKTDARGWRPWLIALVASLSLLPYLLSGYSDARYFTTHFLAAAIFLAYRLSRPTAKPAAFAPNLPLISIATIALTVAVALYYIPSNVINHARLGERMKKEAAQIEALSECQRKTPQTTYIFSGKMVHLPYKYGALTGLPSADLPTNFSRLDDRLKNEFFARMTPYRMITEPDDAANCPL